MNSTAAEPPPGVPPGGQAGDADTGPQTSARSSSQQKPHSEHIDGDDKGGGEEVLNRLNPRPPPPGEASLQASHHAQRAEYAKEPAGSRRLFSSDWGKEPPGPDSSHFKSGTKDPPGAYGPKFCNPNVGPHPYINVQGGGDFPAISGGSVEGGSPCFGGGEGGTTPPAVRWSESLLQLLEDSHGVQLFMEYLEEECGSCESLQFWFACNGLRKSTKRDPLQLVPIIWKRYIRNFVVSLSKETHKTVNDRINARNIDCRIFDDAQREVEEAMALTTYPSFLKSERYLTYLATATQPPGGDSPHTPSPSSPGVGVGSGVLPTLHEDTVFVGDANSTHLRLTQGALAATVKQRATGERRKPEAFAGQYLHGGNSRGGGGGVNPYHAHYSTVHMSSRQDSELQSLSSDALTDDTLSCTDSSVDGMYIGYGGSINPKQAKRQHHKMKENARMNRELAISAAAEGGYSSGQGGPIGHPVPFLPRTHHISKEKLVKKEPEQFARELTEKLQKVLRDWESQDKIQQSFKKIQEGDNVSDECRREHAMNILPPSLLFNKMAKIPLEEGDPSQSILDEHVSRVWQDSNNDTPARSPGSPRPKSPSGYKSGSSQPSRPTALSLHGPKGSVTVSGHPSMYVSGTNYQPSTQVLHSHHTSGGYRSHYVPGHPAHLPQGIVPNPYQAHKSWHHPRRRDRGQDVYSTFSSDSGNVADYNESTDRSGFHPLPKSRSMPEYMENSAGTGSDGGGSNRRQQSSRRIRRVPADLTDSGVSVVSDSGPSLTPSASSTDRVTSWLLESDKFSGSLSSSSFPEHEWDPRARGTRSTHTTAGATSPGSLRRCSSGGGRRSVSGGSLAGVGANSMSGSGSLGGSGSLLSGRPGSLERSGSGWTSGSNVEQRDMSGIHPPHMAHPHTFHQSHSSHEDSKRRSRGGGGGHHGSSRCASHNSGHNWSHSEGSTGRGSGHGDGAPASTSNPSGTGSNGSTLRKQRSSRHSQPTPPGTVYESGGSSSGGSGGGGGGSASVGGGSSSAGGAPSSSGSTSENTTTVVYNFYDDSVPFVIRIPTRPVTLKRFKQHLPKKGNFRFFFKKQCEEFGIIQEEINDDNDTLPLFEGKINAQIRKFD